MLTAAACTKYKEDSFISLRTTFGRLKGSWHVVYFEVNGVDSTANYQKGDNCDIYFYRHEGTQSFDFCGKGNFDFKVSVDEKAKLIGLIDVYVYPSKSKQNPIDPVWVEYKIEKLYNNDWWIRGQANDKTYFIKFKKN
jgi:hypothetical protein